MKPFLAGLTFGLAIGIVAVWIAQGQHSGTLKQEPIKVTVIDADCKDDDGEYTDEFDPDLCIEEDKLQMVDVFKIGLLDFVLPQVLNF